MTGGKDHTQSGKDLAERISGSRAVAGAMNFAVIGIVLFVVFVLLGIVVLTGSWFLWWIWQATFGNVA